MRNIIAVSWPGLGGIVVPGVAERERAPLREQRTDWMRVTFLPAAKPALFRIGYSGCFRCLALVLELLARGGCGYVRSPGVWTGVCGKLLEGY